MRFWFWLCAASTVIMAVAAVMSLLRHDWIDTGINAAITLAYIHWARGYWRDMKREQM